MSTMTDLAKGMAEFCEAVDIVARLHDECAAHPNGQKGWAKDHGVSAAYVNDILQGRRDISDRIAGEFGYSRHVIFVSEET